MPSRTALFLRINMTDYVRLAGRPGLEQVRRGGKGTSWMLPDGRLLAERWDDGSWSWWVSARGN